MLLHNWLIHRSGVNPSPIPRRAMTACYMDGRTISTLTGDRFPLVSGVASGEPYRYVEQLRNDLATTTESLRSAESYVQSLDEHRREHERSAEEYAQALRADLETAHARIAELDAHAKHVEAELAAAQADRGRGRLRNLPGRRS